jgi:ribosomal protein S18
MVKKFDYKAFLFKQQRERALILRDRVDWRAIFSQLANDLILLQFYTDPRGKIVSRRLTRLGDRQQRTLAKLVKRARLAGVLPFNRADSGVRYDPELIKLKKATKKKRRKEKIKARKKEIEELRKKPKVHVPEDIRKALLIEKCKRRIYKKKSIMVRQRRDLRFNAPRTRYEVEKELLKYLWEKKRQNIKVRQRDLTSATIKHVGSNFSLHKTIRVFRRRGMVGKANGPKLWPCRRTKQLLQKKLGKKKGNRGA